MGTSGWAVAELLLAMRMGLAASNAARRSEHPTDAGCMTDGG